MLLFLLISSDFKDETSNVEVVIALSICSAREKDKSSDSPFELLQDLVSLSCSKRLTLPEWPVKRVLVDHHEVNLRHTLLVDIIFSEEEGLVDLLSLHSHRFECVFTKAKDGGGAGHDCAHTKQGLLTAKNGVLADHGAFAKVVNDDLIVV